MLRGFIVRTRRRGSGVPEWTPLFRDECNFDAEIFERVMLNLIKNPNINSSWLFRADILLDRVVSEVSECPASASSPQPLIPGYKGLVIKRLLVRRMIPRNELRDKPLEQSCVFYQGTISEGVQRSLIIYLPHVRSEQDIPFYHPAVRGIAFLHDWRPAEGKGTVSTQYLFFDSGSRTEKLTRTALHLLRVLHKHGEGQVAGYKKRVHHDVLVPQASLQSTYATLKQKYAKSLVEGWEEVTDPSKHVFEDLCIAAFLIELWKEMYKDLDFPGFVDIGCGNGLLVHILNCENYAGWGFDARVRRSWAKYNSSVSVRSLDGGFHVQDSLKAHVLLPAVTAKPTDNSGIKISEGQTHDGIFPEGTFIISNHADELTPWTPILARLSGCPFIMIPCCSHNLGGDRWRAPPPKDKMASHSAYNSLCGWVAEIAEDCGWEVEKEVLRIPSTRNVALVGRRLANEEELDIYALLYKYGGTGGYYDNVVKLFRASARGH
ncbi:hypothetical protein M406DRAFT_62868 [Cryphonectria parasitica EP155]|uniref:tRNA (uracil-O(2)-)-methyltransferase n=1 Tax=Cryphonectria parasitica (strain ATCC 38755 / EP155) TaxID=660469 RepID=A0A9P4Y8R7_CRYP1|nr:uncharacterized protein M406DRAFT_62868 [Cryphonectria parasitica EP155]KAF3768826.1 hypothetical protein M406DRAFT_62868 [Cryphonectria parasitica EP155]